MNSKRCITSAGGKQSASLALEIIRFVSRKRERELCPSLSLNGRTSADDRRTIHAGLKTLHNCMTQQSSIEAAKHTQETLETLAESCAQV